MEREPGGRGRERGVDRQTGQEGREIGDDFLGRENKLAGAGLAEPMPRGELPDQAGQRRGEERVGRKLKRESGVAFGERARGRFRAGVGSSEEAMMAVAGLSGIERAQRQISRAARIQTSPAATKIRR